MSWVSHVIWWQVYPLGFLGAEKDLGALQGEVERLPRLQGWLDHLISWGGNGLLLGPIFTSSSHGYDTVDYFQIDPRLGDDDDFDALVDACRERGVRLLLDGVFNHVGRDFPPVAKALAEGPGSAAEDWVSRLYDTDGVITADYFEGHDNLITLNHSSTRVQDYVRDVMLHWLRRGIDGWRLDAAYAVPASFWAAVLPAVREEFPDAWFVGRDDSRRLHRLREDVRPGLGDAVRAVVGHLDLHRHHQLPRAAMDAGPPCQVRGALHPADVPGQPRRDPGGQPDQRSAALVARGGAARLPARGAVRLLRRRVRPGGSQGERPSGDDAVRPEMPKERWLFTHSHPEVEQAYRRVIGLRRRNPWLVDAMIDIEQVDNARLVIRARARHGDAVLGPGPQPDR